MPTVGYKEVSVLLNLQQATEGICQGTGKLGVPSEML
jgi:hypothetical protein